MIDTFVTAEIDPAEAAGVLEWDASSLEVFARQPGFVSATLYVSQDRSRILTHLQWEREEDHWNCMKSPDFAAIAPPSGVRVPDFVVGLYEAVERRDRSTHGVAAD